MSRQIHRMLWIPSIQEIKDAQAATQKARNNKDGYHCIYIPSTGEFYIEKGDKKEYKYPVYVTYIPPWKDPYEIRQEIIDYINRKVNENNGKV